MVDSVKAKSAAGPARAKRTYNNRRRAASALATRRQILAVSHDLFVRAGYAGTTLGEIAARAGVSVETVQKGFGTKAQLLKAVYDVAVVGDDEPVALQDRPQFQAMATEPDSRGVLEHFAGVGLPLWERIGPLYGAVLAGAGAGDRELVELLDTIRTESTLGAGAVVKVLADRGALRRGMSAERATELVWWLIQPEQYQLLAGVRGWSHEQLADWFVATTADLLLPPSSPSD